MSGADPSLALYSDDALAAEIRRRAAEKLSPPEERKNPDFEPVRKVIVDRIVRLSRGEVVDTHFDKRVFELACEAVYGPRIRYWFEIWGRAR